MMTWSNSPAKMKSLEKVARDEAEAKEVTGIGKDPARNCLIKNV